MSTMSTHRHSRKEDVHVDADATLTHAVAAPTLIYTAAGPCGKPEAQRTPPRLCSRQQCEQRRWRSARRSAACNSCYPT